MKSAMSSESPASALEVALTATLGQGEQDALFLALATGEIVLPQMEEDPAGEGLTLPYIERMGTRYALVFSSRQRLAEFGLDPHGVVTMRGDQLAAAWPQDEEIWLAIDPGTDHSAALSPQSVRELAALGS